MKIHNQKDFTDKINKYIEKGNKSPKGNAWAKINNLFYECHGTGFKLTNDQRDTLVTMLVGKNFTPDQRKIIEGILKIKSNTYVEHIPIHKSSPIAQTEAHVPEPKSNDALIDDIQFGDKEAIDNLHQRVTNTNSKLNYDEIERLQLLYLQNGNLQIERIIEAAVNKMDKNDHVVKIIDILTDRIFSEKDHIAYTEFVNKDSFLLKDANEFISKMIDELLAGNNQAAKLLVTFIGKINHEKPAQWHELSLFSLGSMLSRSVVGGVDIQKIFEAGQKRGDLFCTQEMPGKSFFQVGLINSQNIEALKNSLKIAKYSDNPATHVALARLYNQKNDKKNELNHLIIAAINGDCDSLNEVLVHSNFADIEPSLIDELAGNGPKSNHDLWVGARSMLKGYLLERKGNLEAARNFFELASIKRYPFAKIHLHLRYGVELDALLPNDAWLFINTFRGQFRKKVNVYSNSELDFVRNRIKYE